LAEARQTAEALELSALLARIDGVRGVRAPVAPRTASATFRRDGAYWTVAYEGRAARVKHSKGNDYLAMLLRSPGQELHVLGLAAGGADGEGEIGGTAASFESDAGFVIDPQARAAYKRRLGELAEELEEAQGFNDPGRAEKAQDEIDRITAELSRAIGVGGGHRKAGSAAERARINVSRAIATAVKKITEEHPALGEHLAARVHTGTFCSYAPDPVLAIDWQL